MDEIIAQHEPATSSYSYAHRNHQGSVIAVSNSAGQVNSTSIYTYSPYGEPNITTGFPYRYTGRRLDVETGLYYYRARYYDAQLGRFLQVDPVGYEDQMNLYAYVGSDPVNKVDPTGKIGKLILKLIPKPKPRPRPPKTESKPKADKQSEQPTEQKPVEAAQPKPGSQGGEGAGKPFSEKVKEQAREESGNKCVFCKTDTKKTDKPDPQRSHIDHSIPKSRNGNNSQENAQNTCQTCNLDKGAMTSEEYLEHLGQVGL